MTRDETLTIPVGELLDLIAVEQIKAEGADYKKSQEEEVDELIDMMLTWR